jgi:hypothetical protein
MFNCCDAPCSDDCAATSALNEASRELAASTLLLNPNRHGAPTKEAHQSANRNSVENNMRRNPNQQQKQKPYEGKNKNKSLTSVTCS